MVKSQAAEQGEHINRELPLAFLDTSVIVAYLHGIR